MKDFFISYKIADQQWAEWIAWQLEQAGFTVVIQAWDFRPGANFGLEMQRALTESERTIAVLSSEYLDQKDVNKWSFLFADDPTGRDSPLIPVRVRDVELKGLLANIAYIDLVGLDEVTAKDHLLKGVQQYFKRRKPTSEPILPKEQQSVITEQPLSYPGATLPNPPELTHYLENFGRDHPNPRKTAFIIMRFGSGARHSAIHTAIRNTLKLHGIAALRADDNVYAEELMPNLRTYMHGCGFGIAVFERIETDSHNPNVALEVGYMLALGKRVCLLKDKTVAKLPSDIIGALYTEFDIDDIDSSIRRSLESWMKQRGIIKSIAD